ncbi:MAG: SpoIIE family protein phosphatase [Candidatus Aegiribacteria sp.]|nr:SpoIIE family protein phosphatase [Candidatus Aegiribacteria sp.]
MVDKPLLESEIFWKILDVTRQLSSPVELDEMLVEVVDVARSVLEADRGTVFLFDEQTDELYAEVGTGLDMQEIRFSVDKGIAGLCARTGRIINVSDVYSHDHFNPDIDKQSGYLTGCLLNIPLIGLNNTLVGVMQLVNKIGGHFGKNDERIAEVLASQCAVALQRARLLREYIVKQKLEHDLILARIIQRSLLPEEMPNIPGYDLAGWNEPADQTGGDIFDALSLDGSRVLLLLADVCGHGIGSALSVTQFRAMIRISLRLQCDLHDLHEHANNQLVEDLAGDHFITSFIGILNTEDHRINYHACGQGPLLHFHSDTGEVDQLPASTIPIGIMPSIPLKEPDPIEMAPGDIFALISDGVFEQPDSSNRQFGVESVIRVILENRDQPMIELVNYLREGVLNHAGKQSQDDDMTIVLVKRMADV